jgi:hypothetical protein
METTQTGPSNEDSNLDRERESIAAQERKQPPIGPSSFTWPSPEDGFATD